MSYADLIDVEDARSEYLIVVRPRRRETSWTSAGGGRYTSVFTYGHVTGVSVDGVSLTLAASSSLGANQFYYDADGQVVWARTDGGDISAKFNVITYELSYGTIDAHWHRVPTDTTSRVIYFEPFVKKSPEIKQSVSSVLFGYMPVMSASLQISNAEHQMERHIHDGSFYRAEVLVYHCLFAFNGQAAVFDASNIRLVMRGLCGGIGYDQEAVSLSVHDRVDLFDTEWRPTDSPDFYAPTDFPGLHPDFVGRPVRRVYGVVNGCAMVNVDYVEGDAATTSDNRVHVVRGGPAANVSRTVAATPASTTTRTYLTSTSGIQVGDHVLFSKASPDYGIVSDVSAGYIDHTAITIACAPGDSVQRGTLGNCYIEQSGTVYRPLYGRDYTMTTTAGAVSITFSASLEASLSMQTLNGSEAIWGRIYGPVNTVTKGGVAFGSDNTLTANLTNAGVILYDILKSSGIPESDLDGPSFAELALANRSVGFSLIKDSRSNFMTLKEAINGILGSVLARLYINNDGQWSVSSYGPLAAASMDATDMDILRGDFDVAYSYDDMLSRVVVEYLTDERSQSGLAQSNYSDTARWLHGVKKMQTFQTWLMFDSDAVDIARRLSFIFGQRSGEMTISVKNRFLGVDISDSISVTRSRMPGFEYTEGVEHSRIAGISEYTKSRKRVNIVMDDQLGIEENASAW
jgi:hypothetical protein